MKAKELLQRFFEEKVLEHRIFSVEHDGLVHIVDSEFIQNVIVHHTPEIEQVQIWKVISHIDFLNGDVNDFLEHLAKGYVKTNLKGDR